MLAAGIKGIEEKLRCRRHNGRCYEDANRPTYSTEPARATETLAQISILREALGDDVVDHYTRAAEWEQEEFDRVVTDWEIARGFERA